VERHNCRQGNLFDEVASIGRHQAALSSFDGSASRHWVAGGVAEAIYRGERQDVLRFAKSHCNVDVDLENVKEVLGDLRRLTGIHYDARDFVGATVKLLQTHWRAVEALATELIEDHYVCGERVEKLVARVAPISYGVKWMLLLMTDENATQSGANPGAVMNEVAAITKRLIEGLMEWGGGNLGRILPKSIEYAFEGKRGAETAYGILRARIIKPNARLPIGYHTIQNYLGQGDPTLAHRSVTQIREAMSTLKLSNRRGSVRWIGPALPV
jgi:hypothetical protein